MKRLTSQNTKLGELQYDSFPNATIWLIIGLGSVILGIFGFVILITNRRLGSFFSFVVILTGFGILCYNLGIRVARIRIYEKGIKMHISRHHSHPGTHPQKGKLIGLKSIPFAKIISVYPVLMSYTLIPKLLVPEYQ